MKSVCRGGFQEERPDQVIFNHIGIENIETVMVIIKGKIRLISY
jgi:hypothetical protein